MPIKLKEHNVETYKKIQEAFKKGNKVGIIHPTGTGKSFLALKLIEDSNGKKTLYIAPSNAILHNLKKNILSSGMTMSDFKDLKRMTYQKLIKLTDEEIAKLKPDIIVLDEFHHCGAPEWGTVIEKLLKNNPDAQVLGLSATPIRYFDNGRDMAEELFGENIASEMSLEEAIDRGILPKAKYVATVYKFDKQLDKMQEEINRMTDSKDKEQAQKLFVKLSKGINKDTENLPSILAKNIEIKNGKYIVFCRNIEDMNEKISQAQDIFGEVNSNIKTYKVSSKLQDNVRTLRRFEKDNDENSLKLMFAVDMLNEGYHINDLDGVIMMRPTYSPTIYAQQLGRALTVKEESSKEPLIIDLVNNFDHIKIIEDLYERLRKYKKTGEQSRTKPDGWLKIDDRIKEFMQIANKISQLTKRKKISLQEKIEIFERYYAGENEEIDGTTVFEGKPIGQWATIIRSSLKNEDDNVRPTEEQLEKLIELGILERKFDTTLDEKIDYVVMWYKKYPKIRIETQKTDKSITEKTISKLQEAAQVEGIDYQDLENEYRKMQSYLCYVKTRDARGKLTEEQKTKCKEGDFRGRFGFPTAIENLANKFKIDAQQVVMLIDNYNGIENFLKMYRNGECQGVEGLTSKWINMAHNPFTANYQKLLTDIFKVNDGQIILFSTDNINEMLNSLSEREIKVMNDIYGLTDGKEKSLNNIGVQLGCSSTTVRKAHVKALRKLRSPSLIKNIEFIELNKLKENKFLFEEDRIVLNTFEDKLWESNIIFTHDSIDDINFDRSEFEVIRNLITKIKERESVEEERLAKEQRERIINGEYSDVSIEYINLPIMAYNALKNAGITTLGQLSQEPLERILSLRNIGRKSLKEILLKLEVYGISMQSENDILYKDDHFKLEMIQAKKEAGREIPESDFEGISIAALDFSKRTFNVLKNAMITTLDELKVLTLDDLSEIKSLGNKSYGEILEKLDSYGIKLKTREELLNENERPKLEKLKEDKNADIDFSEITIEALNFSTRTYNLLKSAGITTLEKLEGLTEEELLSFRNLGRMSREEILEKLAEYGISLKSENEQSPDNADSKKTELQELKGKRESLEKELSSINEQMQQAEKLLTDYNQLTGEEIAVSEDRTQNSKNE